MTRQVVMKPSAGGNKGLNRVELLCTPKKVKVPAREKRQPPEAGVLAAGKVYTPPHLNGGVTGGIDQSAVLELVGAGEGQERNLDSVSESSDADSDHEDAEGLENSEYISDDDSDEESDEEVDEEEDGELAGGGNKRSLKESLDLEDALLWEMSQNPNYGEEVDLAAEWELSQARKKGPRGEGDAKSRAKDGSVKRGADRKTGKRRSGGGGNDGGAAGEELDGDSRRDRPTKRREGGRGGGGRGGRGGRGGAGGRGLGLGGGNGRGTPHSPTGTGHSGSFQWEGGRGGFPGRGRGNGGRLGGRGGDRGVGDDGERRMPPPPPPVRSTPYKWGTASKSEGQGATAVATGAPAPGSVVAPAAVSQASGERSEPRRAEAEARQQGEEGEDRGGGGSSGVGADRGAAQREKFGWGGTVAAARDGRGGGGSGGQQHRSAPQMPAISLKGWTSVDSTDRFRFPAQPAAPTAFSAATIPSREGSVHYSPSRGSSSPAGSLGDSHGGSDGKSAEREPEPDSGGGGS